jgi:hypothetical protein
MSATAWLAAAAWTALAAGGTQAAVDYNKGQKEKDKMKAIASANAAELESDRRRALRQRKNLFETPQGVMGGEVQGVASQNRGAVPQGRGIFGN